MAKVSDQSAAVSAILSAAQAVVDLSDGEAVMKARGTVYLPQFPHEDNKAYAARVANSWLFDGVGKCIGDMVGRVFEKPTALATQEGELFGWCQNIDLEGRDLSNFAQDVFEAAIKYGVTYIMADAPPRTEAVTRAQAQSLGLRPYLAHIAPPAVLGWRVDNVNNAPTLTHFRFMETIPAPDRGEFSEETIDQIRSLSLVDGRVVVTLYRKDKRGEFEAVDVIPTALEHIMISPVYTGRTGFMRGKTALDKLARVNLAHWRLQSDFAECQHKSLAPLLFMKAFGEIAGGEELAAGSGYAFTASSDSAELKWVEVDGAGLAEARITLTSQEQQMQWLGLQLILERTGSTTATGELSDDRKSTSRLKQWADNLKDALEIALDWMAELGGIAADTTVVVHKDFSVVAGAGISDLVLLKREYAITPETLVREAQRRGVLSEDIDAAEEVAKAAEGAITAL